MKGFCTVRHPSCFSWEHVLQNVNSVNLPIKTLLAKEIRPASVILTCGTPDYTCKCTDSVGAFLSHIPLGSKQPKDPISESHPPEWENHSPLGSSVSQWKWIQRHLVYISISGRVWGKEKKKHAFILIKHYSSYWGGGGVLGLKKTELGTFVRLTSMSLTSHGKQPSWYLPVIPTPQFLPFFSFQQGWVEDVFQ